MSETLIERYEAVVSQFLEMTLKGKFASKGQIARKLGETIEAGSGEVFERVLMGRSQQLDQQVSGETDELKQAKALWSYALRMSQNTKWVKNSLAK